MSEKYHVSWLLDKVAKGAQPKYIFFWGHKTELACTSKSCLSQWWPAPFTVGELTYPTAEHWMMVKKADLFDNANLIPKILANPEPGAAKALGRKVTGFDQKIWNAAKFDLVVQGSIHKFCQNPDIGDFLMGTGGRILVEASPVDRIWGIGMDQNHPDIDNPALWKGENLLGFALMTARDQVEPIW